MFPCGAGSSGGAGAGVDIEIEDGKKRDTTTWEERGKEGEKRHQNLEGEGGEEGDIPKFGRLTIDRTFLPSFDPLRLLEHTQRAL